MDQARFSADSFDSILEFNTQMREIDATHITQLDPFQVGPQPLTGIELGRIGREPLQMDTVRRAVPQKRLGHVTAVNGGSIPNHDHATGDLPQQMLQKGDHVLRIDCTVLASEIQLALGGNGTDR